MIALGLLLAASWVIAGSLLSSPSPGARDSFDPNFESAGVTIVVPPPKGTGRDAVIDAAPVEPHPEPPPGASETETPPTARRTAL